MLTSTILCTIYVLLVHWYKKLTTITQLSTYTFLSHFKAHSTKKGPICQLPVTSSTGYKGRNRSTSTFSTASSASACYTFHHLNPDHDYGGGDGSDLPMACQQTSKSQPCSHHPSFSGPSGSR